MVNLFINTVVKTPQTNLLAIELKQKAKLWDVTRQECGQQWMQPQNFNITLNNLNDEDVVGGRGV